MCHKKGEKTGKIDRRKFKLFALHEVDKLCYVVFIVSPQIQHDVKMRISVLGGRVLSSVVAQGVPRRAFLQVLGLERVESAVLFCETRREDAKSIIEIISTEFVFSKPGNGKAFAIDVDGYMGARGPLVEV